MFNQEESNFPVQNILNLTCNDNHCFLKQTKISQISPPPLVYNKNKKEEYYKVVLKEMRYRQLECNDFNTAKVKKINI